MEKRVLVLGVIAAVLAVWALLPDRSREEAVVAGTEKTLPAVTGNGVTVMRAETKKDVDLLWRVYQLTNEKPDINFKQQDVYFLGLFESGSCPYEMEDVRTQVNGTNLSVQLTQPEKNCTGDATPRTFYLTVPKQTIKTVSLLNETVSLREFTKEKQAAWSFLQKQGWDRQVEGDWRHAVAYKTTNKQHVEWTVPRIEDELVSVSFLEKENSLTGVPAVLVNPETNKVAGYMPGE